MDVYENAARLLATATRVVVFSGAGISAESGIPTFRDPGGIWDQFDPMEFGTTEGIMNIFQNQPDRIRKFLLETVNIFEQAKPNPAHYVVAELEKMGKISAVITQNIDNLHEDAGSSKVLDVHGNIFRARCISCDRRHGLDKAEFLSRARAVFEDAGGFGLGPLLNLMPKCECGGMTRPDVVMFGEMPQRLNESFRAAMSSEVMLVLGTSGVVYPAAAIPHQAREGGAKIIEVNPSENSYVSITDVYIQEPCGEAMPKVLDHVKELA